MICLQRARQTGVSLIEVMITVLVLMVALLSLAALLLGAQRAQNEANQRAQALVLVQDMVSRVNANRGVATCYAVTTNPDGTPYLGTGSEIEPACGSGSALQSEAAIADLTEWNDLLRGTGQASDGDANRPIGAMIGARGCISFADGVYTITVAWQGTGPTAAPGDELTCAQDLYGHETQRRVASSVVRIANLD